MLTKTNFKINSRIRDIICLAVIVVITLLYVLPIFKNISGISYNTDLTSYLSISYFQKLSIIHYKQFPLWSPYFGGGYPIIGNIEDTSLTLLMPLIVFFGEVTGFKLLCLLLYLIGGTGMYYLTRNIFKYSISGALFSVLVFVFNPYFYICIAGGDPKQLNYLLFPLLLGLFLKSRQSQKWLYICAFIFTFMLFQADFVALVFLLFLALYIIPIIAVKNKTKPYFDFTYAVNFLKLIGVSFLLGAVKFIPLLNILRLNSRDISSYAVSASQAVSLSELLNNLLGISYTNTLQYSVGFIPIIFAICALFIFEKKLNSLILPLIIITWISLGPHAPLDLWRLFRHLPFFHSQQDLDQYYPIVIAFIIALISARFFSFSSTDKKQSITIRVFFCAVLLVYAIIRFAFLPGDFKLFSHPAIKENLHSQTFSQAKILNYSDKSSETDINRDFIGPLQYYLIKNNIGIINWKDCLQLAEHAIPKYYIIPNYFFLAHNPGYTKIINSAYSGEVFTLNKQNKAQLKHFSPLKLIINAQFNTPDTLIINQNYSPYWHTNIGKLESRHGIMAIKFKTPGNYTLELNYIPWDFYCGLCLSLLTLIFILFWLLKDIKPSIPLYEIKPHSLVYSKNTNSIYILLFISCLAILAQLYTLIIPAYVLINSTCVENARQDVQFIRTAQEIKPQQAFGLKNWAVGQYAVYKITWIRLTKNTYRYKIAITGKETIDNQEYFWLEHTLYTNDSEKRAVFKTLRSPLSKKDLLKNPWLFFCQGIYPKNAKRFIMQIEDNPQTEIALNKLNQVISPLDFSVFPGLTAINKQDTIKPNIRIFAKQDCLSINKKPLQCKHLLIEINPGDDNYRFNLWNSKQVPILGLVQMDLYRPKSDPDYNSYPEKIVIVNYGIENK